MEGNNAPFAIGQKVICLVEMGQFSCGCWWVDVGVINTTGRRMAFCADHQTGHVADNGNKFFYPGFFAPIQTQYTDATSEILEKFPVTEETPDKILIPEPVNN